LGGEDVNDEDTRGGTAISNASRHTFMQEPVQEFQALSTAYSAEFGRSVMRRKAFIWTAIVAVLLANLVQIAHGMDLVRAESQTDAAVATYGVTGHGVTVAILDRGIDWRNPDFIKVDGTTRIKWILDLSGQNSV
jgi:subtilisin family serine protease